MKNFPDFMRNSANRIAAESQYTKGIEGYVYDGADGSQVCYWSYSDDGVSAPHTHPYDEYMLVVEGEYTVIIDGWRTRVKAGEEHIVRKGVLHSGEVAAGTRAIYAFGGKRAKRVGE
jgi:quercetin dioxygenase-like cupin family protein